MTFANRLRPLRPVAVGERLRSDDGVDVVLGVVDLPQRLDRARMSRFRQRSKNIRRLLEPATLLGGFGEHVTYSLPVPSAPSPTESTGPPSPRRLQSRSRSAHGSADSRNPSASTTCSLRHRRGSRSSPADTPCPVPGGPSDGCRRPTGRCNRRRPGTDPLECLRVVLPLCRQPRDRRGGQPCTGAEELLQCRPKSELDRPCRYGSGNTSVNWGLLRAHAGRIAEANRLRSPVASRCAWR